MKALFYIVVITRGSMARFTDHLSSMIVGWPKTPVTLLLLLLLLLLLAVGEERGVQPGGE